MGKNRYGRIIILSLILIVLSTTLVLSMDITTRGDIVNFFRNSYVPSNIVVRGDAVTLFGNNDIDGDVTGDVVTIFGNAVINGKVNGDIVAIFGSATVNDYVGGDVVSVMGGIAVNPAGQINGSGISVFGSGIDNQGTIRQQEMSVMGIFPRGMAPISTLILIILVITIMKQLTAFVFSAIALVLFNERLDRMAVGMNHDSGKKFLIGLLVYFGSFVAIAVLVMTVIGIPLVILLIPAMLLIEFLGNTTAKIAIGKKIAEKTDKEWTPIIELLIGTIVYLALEISIIGKLVTLVLKYIGIGEIIDSRLGEMKTIVPKGD